MRPMRSRTGLDGTSFRSRVKAQTSAANLVLSFMLPPRVVAHSLVPSVEFQFDELSRMTSRFGGATPPVPAVKMSMSSAMTREEPPATRAAAKVAARGGRKKEGIILKAPGSLRGGGGTDVVAQPLP